VTLFYSSPVALAVRGIGTQTPLWRARQAAFHLSPVKSLHDAAALTEMARLAATSEKGYKERQHDCLVHIWELRGLVRDRTFKDALNAASGDEGLTLLQVASREGFADCVEKLLEIGASARLSDSKGQTALHLAAGSNRYEVARLLLANGKAAVNARDQEGRTPLHMAAVSGGAKVSRVLMRFGAQADATNRDGRTAVELAPPRNPLRTEVPQYVKSQKLAMAKVGRYGSFKGLGSKLPAHFVAPKLALTPVGYCPFEDGEIKQLKRGIRNNKKRPAPSGHANNRVNYYCPRG